MNDNIASGEGRSAAAVLAEAAAVAAFAPSIHNTQPWRWRVTGDELDLYADRSRQLMIADPEGRLLTISAGTALHHVRVALAAEGWKAKIDRVPESGDPDHLAHLTLAGRIPVTAEAMMLFQTVRLRHTDRRPVTDTPPTAAALAEVRQAVTDESIDAHLLTPEQVLDLGTEAAVADRVEAVDPQQRTELAYWIGGDRAQGSGVPDSVIPRHPPATVVPGRDFVQAGTLPVGQGHDRAAAYLMLFGAGDEPADWLRAGEALSAAWLAATARGLSVLPFSSVIEVAGTRAALRRMLAGLGHPYLVLRLGTADPDEAFPPRTPRLPTDQTIDISSD